jgi:hypothetical protein
MPAQAAAAAGQPVKELRHLASLTWETEPGQGLVSLLLQQ